MTIRFLVDWNGYRAGQTATLGSTPETRLVSAGLATTDLTVGVTAINDALTSPEITQQSARTGEIARFGSNGELQRLDGTLESLPRLEGRRYGAIGHSIPSNSRVSTATAKIWTPYGYLAWVRRFLGHRIDLTMDRVWAVSGKTAAQVRDEQVPLALAANLDGIFIDCWINSITGGATYDQLAALFCEIVEPFRRRGVVVELIGVRVLTAGVGSFGDVQAALVARFNDFMARYALANRGVYYHDVNAAVLDFATGRATATYFNDTTHDNVAGAWQQGKAIAAAMAARLAALDRRMSILQDTPAAGNPNGNLMVNGLMAGTTGVFGGTATGVLAQGYAGYHSGATTSTGTFSKTAVAGVTNLSKQTTTWGGTGDGATWLIQQVPTIGATIQIGDTIQLEVEVDLNSIPAGMTSLKFGFACRSTGGTIYSQSWDGYDTTSGTYGLFPAMTESGLLFRTDPVVVAAGSEVVDIQMLGKLPASGSMTGSSIRVGRAALRKVT